MTAVRVATWVLFAFCFGSSLFVVGIPQFPAFRRLRSEFE
jgi:hypothetical protein